MIEISWIILLLAIALDLIVVSVRSSFVNIHLSDLNNLRSEFGQAVDRTITLIEKPRFRASLRLAVGITHFLVAAAVLALLESYYSTGLTLAATFVIILCAAAIFMVLEYAFEGRFLIHYETLALRLTPVASFLNAILAPFTLLMVALGGLFNRPLDITSPILENALRTWAQDGHNEGGLEQGERKMIYSIFQFGDTFAREIMIPRIDITALEITTPLTKAIDILIKTGHSRVPVYDEAIDNIIGMLYAKDLLQVKDQPNTLASFRQRLRPTYFVPETKKVDELLTEMQTRHIHVAIVVDEYGGVAGLVTLEDIMEEIVGDIQDEYDQAEEQIYQQITPDEYLFQGKISLDDFNDIMDAHLEKDDADTLAGFIFSHIGRVPTGGESVVMPDLVLTVEQVSGRRIRKVRARRIQTTQEQEVENSNADR